MTGQSLPAIEKRQSDLPRNMSMRAEIPVSRDEDDFELALFAEASWRQPKTDRSGSDLTVTRWVDVGIEPFCARTVTPAWCHTVAVAIRPSRLSLSTLSHTLVDGTVASGTVHISAPGQELRARFTPPFDFIHLYIDNDRLVDAGLMPDHDNLENISNYSAPLFRDSLVEALAQSIPGNADRPHYISSVGNAIIARVFARRQTALRCRALPKWRIKRLEHHIAEHIDEAISLDEMAAVVGLSKMHFAAQFRTATGFRPHEFLLLKRVEQAKAALLETKMPLVEVALSVGFNAQAHFSTVFKRFTGQSPAQWKQQYQGAHLQETPGPQAGRRPV